MDEEAVVPGHPPVWLAQDRILDGVLDNGGFQVVHHHFLRATAEELQGVAVAGDPRLDRLVDAVGLGRTHASATNSTYICREYESVMTNAYAVRGFPVFGSLILPTLPKSTWACSPGAVSIRTVTSLSFGQIVFTNRRTEV